MLHRGVAVRVLPIAPRIRRAPVASPGHLPQRGALAVAALALAAMAAALTPPGEAVADWLRDTVVRPAPHDANVAPARLKLPGGGVLLARTPSGGWTLAADGTRRRGWAAAKKPRGRRGAGTPLHVTRHPAVGGRAGA